MHFTELNAPIRLGLRDYANNFIENFPVRFEARGGTIRGEIIDCLLLGSWAMSRPIFTDGVFTGEDTSIAYGDIDDEGNPDPDSSSDFDIFFVTTHSRSFSKYIELDPAFFHPVPKRVSNLLNKFLFNRYLMAMDNRNVAIPNIRRINPKFKTYMRIMDRSNYRNSLGTIGLPTDYSARSLINGNKYRDRRDFERDHVNRGNLPRDLEFVEHAVDMPEIY